MIRLRAMASAYLENDGAFLLMKRSEVRQFAPGIWATVGGHMEPDEIGDPRAACLREIREETGLSEEQISGLALRYIILRRSGEEIRVQYVFFGHADSRGVGATDEGELQWIKRGELLDRRLSYTSKATLEHFLQTNGQVSDILVGTVSAEGSQPVLHWLPLQDWEGI